MESKIISIKGDASFRSFYRIIINKKSKIIISAKKEKYKNLVAYTAVNKFLRKNKILAPKLFARNYKQGIFLIEDFGNISFYDILIKQKNKLKTYKRLVDLLLQIQKIKPKSKIKNIFNKSHLLKKYSTKHLLEESDLFFDWYLPLFLNKKKTLNIKKKLNKILLTIYKKLNFKNSSLVHKDYHSQNLMKVGTKIGIIDNQDAIIGNPAYDLVSLIDDVRIKTSSNLKNKIYKYYLKKNLTIPNAQSKNFLKDFNILSVQRSLKIIGVFSRLYKRDKKNIYLQFIPYTWKLLEMRMNSESFLKIKKILDINISTKIRKKVIFK
jgi:aminoglycoside/choline kinase family phosphotransferase